MKWAWGRRRSEICCCCCCFNNSLCWVGSGMKICTRRRTLANVSLFLSLLLDASWTCGRQQTVERTQRASIQQQQQQQQSQQSAGVETCSIRFGQRDEYAMSRRLHAEQTKSSADFCFQFALSIRLPWAQSNQHTHSTHNTHIESRHRSLILY